MGKAELVAECSRLLLSLTKANAKIDQLEQHLTAKNNRDKKLTQQVLDTKKANEKLKNIVNALRDEQYITEEAANILKVI